MAMLHSLASKCGFSEFPSKTVCFPSNIDVLKERIGFNCHVLESMRKARGDDDDEEEEEEPDENPDEDMAAFLHEIDLDVPGVDGPVMEFEQDEFEPINVFATIDTSMFVPKVVANENTHETFCRKTNDMPWVPFAALKDASAWSELDKAEHTLFDEMSPSYSRQAGLDTAKGYKTFAKAWDLQVANLYSAAVTGDTGVQHVNWKSYMQLQQHYDNLKRQKELLAEAAMMNTDEQMKNIDRVFKSARQDARTQPHQLATQQLTNVSYNPQLGLPQFGVPLALNTNIAARAFQHNRNCWRTTQNMCASP